MTATPPYEIVTLQGFPLQSAASALYRETFGYSSDAFSISPRLLTGLIDNGGSALGAAAPDGTLLAFCYGFAGVENGRLYHYSQATAVRAGARGLGLGRALKYAQAGVALATGATTMRWTYDPFNSRNTHFNLSVLGARGIRFFSDYYDEPDTDRVVVEWSLEGARPLDPTLVAAAAAAAADASGLSSQADGDTATLRRGSADGIDWVRASSVTDDDVVRQELARRLGGGWVLAAGERLADDSRLLLFERNRA